MKSCVFSLKLILIFFLMCTPTGASKVLPPPEGGVLPDIVLTVPDTPKQKEYLGLNVQGTFKITEIKAEVVIIEVFSMY